MNKCIACDTLLVNKLIVFNNMPRAAQHMPSKPNLNEEKGMDLCLYQCPACGLVQFDAPPVEYYKDVIRATKVSPKYRKLRCAQYEKLIDTFQLEKKKILEVGCGAGEFLEILDDFPVDAYGIEHCKKLVEAAREKGLNVYEGFVEDEKDIFPEAPFDAFVCFNFLEHQPNPSGMIKGIAANLNRDGVGLLTVPSFDYFQEHASYFGFLRDHVAYYTEDSLQRILEINGFDVVEMSHFDEDTLEAIVKKRQPIHLADYIGQKQELERELNTYLSESLDEEGEVFVWGASHQAFTILATIKIIETISAVIDSASFKWGKYTPVTHIPIVSPQILENICPKCIIIIAPEFSDEIFNTILERCPAVNKVITIVGSRAIWLKREEKDEKNQCINSML